MPKSTAKKKPLSANKQLYKKQEKRIKSFYKRAEKRGYRFDTKETFDSTKRITQKELKRLSQLTPRKLYETATYLDPVSGKTVSGTEGRVIERRTAYYKAREKQMASPYTPMGYGDDGYYEWLYEEQYDYSPPDSTSDVLQNIEDLFNLIDSFEHKDSWSPDFRRIKTNDKNMLLNMLTGAISQLGRRQVAENIEANATELKNQVELVLYGSSGDKKDGVQPNLIKIHEILFQRSPDMWEAEQYMDEHENWGDTPLDFDEYEPED